MCLLRYRVRPLVSSLDVDALSGIVLFRYKAHLVVVRWDISTRLYASPTTTIPSNNTYRSLYQGDNVALLFLSLPIPFSLFWNLLRGRYFNAVATNIINPIQVCHCWHVSFSFFFQTIDTKRGCIFDCRGRKKNTAVIISTHLWAW